MPNPSTLTPSGLDDPPPSAAPAARPLTRRRALPGGRAVVGGFLVALAALGIFAAYTSATAPPTTGYAVARHDLPLGTRIGPGDLALLPMELPPESAAGAFSDARRLVGRIVVGPIHKGDLIQGGDVVDKQSGPDEIELSVPVEADRALAGALRPGEEVDVVATFGSGAEAFTALVVRAARVIAVNQGRGPLPAGSAETVTVAVRRGDDALAIVHALNTGQIALIRTSGAGAVPPGSVYQTPRGPRPPT